MLVAFMLFSYLGCGEMAAPKSREGSTGAAPDFGGETIRQTGAARQMEAEKNLVDVVANAQCTEDLSKDYFNDEFGFGFNVPPLHTKITPKNTATDSAEGYVVVSFSFKDSNLKLSVQIKPEYAELKHLTQKDLQRFMDLRLYEVFMASEHPVELSKALFLGRDCLVIGYRLVSGRSVMSRVRSEVKRYAFNHKGKRIEFYFSAEGDLGASRPLMESILSTVVIEDRAPHNPPEQ